MSRMYIDAITLLNNRPTPPDSLDVKGIEGFRCCLRMYNAQIEKQIANRDTDVVEVRRGEWLLPLTDEPWRIGYFCRCSVCKYINRGHTLNVPDFCENCGAKMDGEENR